MQDRLEPSTRTKRRRTAARSAVAIDLSTAKRSPGRLVHDAHVRLRAGLVRVLEGAGHDISAEGWSVLSILWEEDGLTQLAIGERVRKDRHHTSRLVDALEQQGLVSRASTDEDRRLKRVSLTALGRATRSKLTRIVTKYLEGVFEGISQSDYDVFIRCLEHVIDRAPQPEGSRESGE